MGTTDADKYGRQQTSGTSSHVTAGDGLRVGDERWLRHRVSVCVQVGHDTLKMVLHMSVNGDYMSDYMSYIYYGCS